MHEIAEFRDRGTLGYKEETAEQRYISEKLTGFRPNIDGKWSFGNAEDYMESLTIDLFSDMVFVLHERRVMDYPWIGFNWFRVSLSIRGKLVKIVQSKRKW